MIKSIVDSILKFCKILFSNITILIISLLIFISILTYLFFTKEENRWSIVEKFYHNEKNIDDEDVDKYNEIECLDFNKSIVIIDNIYRTIINGGEISQNLEILCKYRTCNKNLNNNIKLIGLIGIKKILNNTINEINNIIPNFNKQTFNLKKHISVIRKDQIIPENISDKKSLAYILYQTINAIDSFEYEKAIGMINMIESFITQNKCTCEEDIAKIKSELENVIMITEALKIS